MHEAIFRNLPGNSDWLGSFYERLTEEAVWDKEEFWKLHLGLVEAARVSLQSETIPRDLALAVARIHSRVWRLVAAHYDPNDVFVIANLTPNELVDYLERFDHSVLGVFSGECLSESLYDLQSPLLSGA